MHLFTRLLKQQQQQKIQNKTRNSFYVWVTEHLPLWNFQSSEVGEANRHQSKSKANMWNENFHKYYKKRFIVLQGYGGLIWRMISILCLFLSSHTLQCIFTASLIKKWNLFSFSLNPCWPCDFLWPIESGRSDIVSSEARPWKALWDSLLFCASDFIMRTGLSHQTA